MAGTWPSTTPPAGSTASTTFGDSGFGPLQQEFIYTNFIARDLTARIVAAYEALTGRALDPERIELLSGVLRLAELAAYADDPDQAPAMLRCVADWHDTAMARGDRIG